MDTPAPKMPLSAFRRPIRRRGKLALSLRLRFLAFVAVLSVTITGAFAGADLLVDFEADKAHRKSDALRLKSIVDSLADVYLPDRHYLSLEQLLEAISQNSDILSVAIYDWRSTIYADGDPRTPLGAVASLPPLLVEAHEQDEMRTEIRDGVMTLAFPIVIGDASVAAAQLALRTPTIGELAGGIAGRSGLVMVAVLLAVLPLAWVLLGCVLQPLNQLTDACRRVARGDMNVEVSAKRHDEIGLLAVRFRRMMRQLRRSIERIHHLAFIDGVTSLPNRSLFRESAGRAITLSKSTGCPGAVLFIDLDRFKRVNDTLGHDFGDLLLREFAERLRGCVRTTDAVSRLGDTERQDPDQSSPLRVPTVARLGGDEFSLLLPRLRLPTDAAIVARRVLRAARQPFELKGHRVFVGASIGIAVFPDDGTTLDDLLRAADLALYYAKDQGRGTFEFFSRSLKQKAAERFRLENDLRSAIENEEFELYYQPIVDPRCRSLRGVEALLRWRHPTRGIVDPGTFIGVAEETRMIVEIGTWVLRAACRQAKAWNAAGHPVKISVNVSLAQFERPGFADTVIGILEEVGLPPHLLQLEITESLAMTDPEHTAAMVAPLRSAGVSFALDDFGTGYSSLSILSSLPIDGLKIDRSFISQAETDAGARVIIETILAMARTLRYATIAEGVEERGQADFLAARGCTLVQGYLYSKPLPLSQLEADFFDRRQAGVRT